MIEPITQAEFKAVRRNCIRTPSEEGQAVRALSPGTGIKFPCRWNHTGKTAHCGGGTLAHLNAQNAGFRIVYRCKDKVLYVFRYE